MCPPCDETCDFWFYSSSCLFARISMLFDNLGDYQAEDKNDLQNERQVKLFIEFSACNGTLTQLLYYQWSHWTNFYKTQPLENIRYT